jgi:hypothetical protein
MKIKLDQIKKNIPETDGKNPTVIFLLELLEQQAEIILRLQEEIQVLKDEIARLKNHKPKPKIKPSKLAKKIKANSSEKRAGSAKRSKTASLVINKTKRVPPESIPAGSTFKGLKPFTVKHNSVYNILYQLEQWQTPEGKIISGQLPPGIDGHFDHSLRSYILYQYHHCHVTQPLLLEQLREWGVDISSGQLNNLLTENHNPSMTKKRASYRLAWQSSSYKRTIPEPAIMV